MSFRVDLMSLVKRSLREFHLLAHLIFQRGQFFDSIQRHGRCFGEVKIYLRVIFEISQGMSLVGTLDVSASISKAWSMFWHGQYIFEVEILGLSRNASRQHAGCFSMVTGLTRSLVPWQKDLSVTDVQNFKKVPWFAWPRRY